MPSACLLLACVIKMSETRPAGWGGAVTGFSHLLSAVAAVLVR